MLSAERELRIAQLREELDRLTGIVEESRRVEARLLAEGRHPEWQLQHEQTTLEAERQRDEKKFQIRQLEAQA